MKFEKDGSAVSLNSRYVFHQAQECGTKGVFEIDVVHIDKNEDADKPAQV